MNQKTRDAIELIYFRALFCRHQAFRGRKLNEKDEKLLKATFLVHEWLEATKTLVELEREGRETASYGVSGELMGWLCDLHNAALDPEDARS